jgi:hypothetical protein
MKKPSSKSIRLDGPSRDVLGDIRHKIELAGTGVDATYYRAQHREHLDLLDKLERLGFLRKDQDKYWVTFYGLILLKDEKSKRLLKNCEQIFYLLQAHYEAHPKTKAMVLDLARSAELSYSQVAECLGYMCESYSMGSRSGSFDNPSEAFIEPGETILRYKKFKEIIDEGIDLKQKQYASKFSAQFIFDSSKSSRRGGGVASLSSIKELDALGLGDPWGQIKIDFGTSKKAFGKKIGFVSDSFKREVIFRDIGQAHLLAEAGFAKPAVILAGSVLEELLRLFLEFKGVTPTKDTFDCYIKTCIERRLLKSPVHQLTDSVRQFRNLVHLKGESIPRHTISKATAKGAVSNIFTIANDFD